MAPIAVRAAALVLAVTLAGPTTEAADVRQAEPLILLCSENSATLDGRPWGPLSIRLRVDVAGRSVELLRDDRTVWKRDAAVVIRPHEFAWGTGIYGLNTWKQLGLPNNVSNFEGTVDREAATAWVRWEDVTAGREFIYMFRGKCQAAKPQF